MMPEIPENALPIAGVVWILVGMLKPLLYRAGFKEGFIADVIPVLNVVLAAVAARLYVTDEWANAVLIGAVMAITAAGLHDVHDHYTNRSSERRRHEQAK